MRQVASRIAIACALIILLAGAFFASSMGRDFLRHELEDLLSDLMEGEVRIPLVRLELHSGLALRGYDVSVYPTNEGPGLLGGEVYAELNETALLQGSFQLAVLSIEDLEVRLQLDRGGEWRFPPLRALFSGPLEIRRDDPDSLLLLMTAIDAVTEALMKDRPIADLVSIQHGVVRFEDREVTGANPVAAPANERPPAAQPLSVAFEGVQADLSRPWRSGESDLRLIATLIDHNDHATPIQIRGRGARDRGRSISLEVEDLDLDVLDRYAPRLGAEADLDGHVSGTLSFDSTEKEHLPTEMSLEATLALDGVVSKLTTGDQRIEVALPVTDFDLRLEVSSDYFRVARAEASGDELSIGLEAIVERPLAASSFAQISVEIRGTRIEDVQPTIDQLPADTLASLQIWFDSIQSGHFERFGISGAAPLSDWIELRAGTLQSLPDGFLLSFRVSDVTALLDDGATIENLQFAATLTAEELVVSGARGDWRGEPSPTVDVTVVGLPRFLALADAPLVAPTREVGGASYLWELVSSAGSERAADTANNDPRRLEVDLDYLHHPLLGWPLENARITIDPTTNGTRAHLAHAWLGGIPIHGEVIYEELPEPRLSFSLEAELRDPTRRPLLLTHSAGGSAADPPWASGHFVLEPVQYDPTPAEGVLSMLSGDFALRRSQLDFEDVHLAVGPEARAQIQLSLELYTRDEVGLSLEAHIADVQLSAISDAFGLPPDFVTGTTQLDLMLGGVVRRSDDALQGIVGTAEFTARDGEIRQKIPMVVALAAASGGFNPFASRVSMHYDTIEGDLHIQDGRVFVRRFELEGPIRVYATGSLEFGDAPHELDGVVGVFLFQRSGELLGKVPLVNLVMPGSEKGMVGAYFALDGSFEEPDVSTMKMKSLQEQLPDIITKPFEFLHSLLPFSDEPEPAGAPRPKDAAGESEGV